MSPFHLISAATAAIPLWLFSIHEGIPWYYFASIIAGELLLVYVSGLISSLLLAPVAIGRQASCCPKCGAPLTFAGRHFDPLGSQRPHWSDILIFVVFLGLNIIVWISVLRGDL